MPAEPWTSQFRHSALKRIGEYEAFLESCGITPVAGTELEFHFSSPQPLTLEERNIREFRQSSFVEVLKDEVLHGVGEIVIGKGPNSRTAIYPKERYPSTIARATKSAKNILERGGPKYGMDITFGERSDGLRIRSLQCNISLWNSADYTPLFLPDANSCYLPNALTNECAISLIEAQKALSALVSPHRASFERYKDKGSIFGVKHQDDGSNNISALLRRNWSTPFVTPQTGEKIDTLNSKHKPSVYFEDRLASSEAEPALAMLIILGGMVNGVKSYMEKKRLVDADGVPAPEKMKAHINSPQFCETLSTAQSNVFSEQNASRMKAIAIPRKHKDALHNLKANDLAREIMGEEFYETFCAAYEKQTQQQRGIGGMRQFLGRFL